YLASSRALDCLLVPAGALAGCLAVLWFLNVLGLFGLIFWLLSCLAFVMGIWAVEERTRSLLGLVSLTAGAVMLFMANNDAFPRNAPAAHTQSFCLGCVRGLQSVIRGQLRP